MIARLRTLVVAGLLVTLVGVASLDPYACVALIAASGCALIVAGGAVGRVALILLASAQPLLWLVAVVWLVILNPNALKTMDDVLVVTGGRSLHGAWFNVGTPVIFAAYALMGGIGTAVWMARRYRLRLSWLATTFVLLLLLTGLACRWGVEYLKRFGAGLSTSANDVVAERGLRYLLRLHRSGVVTLSVMVPYRGTVTIDDSLMNATAEEELSFDRDAMRALDVVWVGVYHSSFADWLASRSPSVDSHGNRTEVIQAGSRLIYRRQSHQRLSCNLESGRQVPIHAQWPAPMAACFRPFEMLVDSTTIVPDAGSILRIHVPPGPVVVSTSPTGSIVEGGTEEFRVPIGFPRPSFSMDSLFGLVNDDYVVNLYMARESFRSPQLVRLLRLMSRPVTRWTVALVFAGIVLAYRDSLRRVQRRVPALVWLEDASWTNLA